MPTLRTNVIGAPLDSEASHSSGETDLRNLSALAGVLERLEGLNRRYVVLRGEQFIRPFRCVGVERSAREREQRGGARRTTTAPDRSA
jgi:hypothetical protein